LDDTLITEPTDAANPAIALWLQAGRQRRGVADPDRWAERYMKLILAGSAFVILLAGTCPIGSAADTNSTKALRDLFEGTECEDIMEACFRYQFLHFDPCFQEMTNVFFLSISFASPSGDPSDDFMKRFAGHTPPVKRRSQCKPLVVDKETGKNGIILNIFLVTMVSETEVKVEGNNIYAPLDGFDCTYHLKKEKSKWMITKYESPYVRCPTDKA
jgi:hypothetical protein